MYKVIWFNIEDDKEHDTSFNSAVAMAKFVVNLGNCIDITDIRVERS